MTTHPKNKNDRKCLSDATNKVTALKPSPSLQSMEHLEQTILELNHRLDALGTRFESLISSVQEQNRQVSKLMIPLLPPKNGTDCSSSTHTPSSLDERSMKEQVKRSILGDDGYSVYRKVLQKKHR